MQLGDRFRWLIWFSLVEIRTMLAFSNHLALLPIFQKEGDLTNPAILLLDEPFGALDAQTRALMQELLTQVWEELHKTTLFVTHDVEEAIFFSDRVFVMAARPGKIKAEIDIPLEGPRSYEIKATEAFLRLKKQALAFIWEEAIKATQYK